MRFELLELSKAKPVPRLFKALKTAQSILNWTTRGLDNKLNPHLYLFFCKLYHYLF